MNGVDLARFDFDYDNTWQAFFLDAELNVYSRYGGRDASSPESRLSLASLRHTLEAVLAAHASRSNRPDPRPDPEPDARPGRPAAPRPPACPPAAESLPEPTVPAAPVAAAAAVAEEAVFQRTPRRRQLPTDFPLLKQHHSGCLHCHQVQEYRLLQSFADGAFDPGLLFPFPLPENVGLEFDRDHGHRVARVREGSAAARAGLEVGDVLTQAGGQPIRSEDDFRWTLHHAPQSGTLTVVVLREGQRGAGQPGEAPPPEGAVPNRSRSATRVTRELELGPDWKRGDVSWRKSLRSYPVVWGFLGYSLGTEERREAGLGGETLALKVVSLRGQAPGLAQALGLQKGDLILALEGETQKLTLEQFKSKVIGRYRPGSPLEWRVLRGGREVEVKGVFPNWHSSDRTVP